MRLFQVSGSPEPVQTRGADMSSTADPTTPTRPVACPDAHLARLSTEPGQRPAWRPPVRLVGWLELLRRVQPTFA